MAATRKGLREQLYNARIVAIMHFHTEQGVKLKKSKIIKGGINLTKEQFMSVSKFSFYYVLVGANLHYLVLDMSCYDFSGGSLLVRWTTQRMGGVGEQVDRGSAGVQGQEHSKQGKSWTCGNTWSREPEP
jgi:hypothetical protein